MAGWLAHLANDAATVGASATEAEICAYYEACAAACNCVMLPFGQAAPVSAHGSTQCTHSPLHPCTLLPDGDGCTCLWYRSVLL